MGDTFPNVVPTLGVKQHTAIPRTDDDLTDSNFLQAITNTAGFHFAFIEQGGTSLYPKLAQRVTSVDVLRMVLAIGGTEIAHFQTWHDKAGNAIPGSATDPVTGVPVTFPDLTQPSVGEDLKSNLIMPEPTVFLKNLPVCSIIRPTATKRAAMGALAGLTEDGLFSAQPSAFFDFMRGLAADATMRNAELANSARSLVVAPPGRCGSPGSQRLPPHNRRALKFAFQQDRRRSTCSKASFNLCTCC